MQPLLFLAHRIPYPPNKGDKIRSYHLLKYLARYFDVYLGAFVDNADDWAYRESLKEICQEVSLIPLHSSTAKLRSLQGLLTGKALTLPYYFDGSMQKWVNKTVEEHSIRHCVTFSSAMAQYLMSDSYKEMVRIADFVDVDSDKWHQYGDAHGFPLNWLYVREGDRLGTFEKEVARDFQGIFFVSRDELKVFEQNIMKHPTKWNASTDAELTLATLDYYNNGVDYDYFDPTSDFIDPFAHGQYPMVFTGAMDYWANVDAVKWFSLTVLPRVRREVPNAVFYIVGSNPTEEVKGLARRDGVVVTGSVADVRPYLRYAHFVVAPLRIARGIQNKVLEAMAMAKCVVASPQAMEGIAPCEAYQPIVAADATEFVSACVELLGCDAEQLYSQEARACIEREYNWAHNLSRLGMYLGIEADGVKVQSN